jgi:hypothetical protein
MILNTVFGRAQHAPSLERGHDGDQLLADVAGRGRLIGPRSRPRIEPSNVAAPLRRKRPKARARPKNSSRVSPKTMAGCVCKKPAKSTATTGPCLPVSATGPQELDKAAQSAGYSGGVKKLLAGSSIARRAKFLRNRLIFDYVFRNTVRRIASFCPVHARPRRAGPR